jgi:YVTN family beta-propeller protein
VTKNRKKAICIAAVLLLFSAITLAEERVFVVNSYVHGSSPLWSTISMLRGSDLTILDTYQTYDNAHSIAATPDGMRLWITCPPRNYIVVMNAISFEKIKTIDLGDIIINRPTGVAITPDGRYAYVTFQETGEVGVYDAHTAAYVTTLSVGGRPDFIVFTPDGSKAYLVDYQNVQVRALRTSDNTIVKTLNFTGTGLQDAVVSPDGSRVYVSNMYGNQIEVIRTSDDNALTPIPTSLIYPRGIGISSDGDYLFIGHYLAVDAVVNMLRLSDNTVVSTADIPSNPRRIAVRPDGSRIFVSEHNEDECYAYDVSGESLTFAEVADLNTVPGYYASPVGLTIVNSPSNYYVFHGHDFDGNGVSDISVWRPSNGRWYIRDQGVESWGRAGDIPVPGDYNGDDTTDLAVWRSSNGRWYIKDIASHVWGIPGDIPVPGDYDGDGTTDIAVWRPSNGRWYIRGQGGYNWGVEGDAPVPGDYDGDGTTDIAVWRPSTGRWYIMGIASHLWGVLGDVPVLGDYNGDGTSDIAVWRPSNGRWYIKDSGSYAWGQAGDIPVPGNYDGDVAGVTDMAVWRPSNGRWYLSGLGTYSYGRVSDIVLVR